MICEYLGALTTARTSKRILDLLEPVELIVWKVVIQRVTEWTADVPMVLTILKSRYGRYSYIHECDSSRRDLVREGKVFVRNNGSRVGCIERRVVYFRKLLISPMRRNSVLE